MTRLAVICALLWLLALNFIFADSFYPNAGIDTTDEALTVPFHHSQWLLNLEWDRLWDLPFTQILTPAFKYGISDRLDFGIQFPYTTFLGQSPQLSGFNDWALGIKYLWTPLKENHLWFSTIFGVKPQSADFNNNLGTGSTDFSFHFAATFEQGKWCNHLNYGYNFLGKSPVLSRQSHAYYKYKLDYETSPQWNFSGEIYGERSANLDLSGSPLQTTLLLVTI